MRTRQVSRVFAIVGLLGVLTTALASCSGLTELGDGELSPPTVVPKRGGRVVYGLEADPNGLDPTRNAWDSSGIQLANALFDPIAAFDAEGVARPYLVSSIEPNGDFTEWTFRLRENVRFSDGDPLDTDDIAVWVQKLRDSAITGPPAQLISGFDIIDPVTYRIRMSKPWASLPGLLAGQGGYVPSPKQLNADDGTSKPLGTGPFLLRRWEQNTRFELVRNPHYWRPGLPYLDAVDFVVDEQGGTRIEKLLRGEIDVTALSHLWDLQALDEAIARQGDSSTVRVERDLGDSEKMNITLNTTRPPLNDVRVRKAIAHATDVPAIAARNGWPIDRLAQGPISPDSPFFSPASYPTHDVAKARELIRQYQTDPNARGRSREITFTLKAPAGHSGFVSQLVEQWAEAGIKAKVEFLDIKQAVRFAVLGDFDALIFRFFAAPDPDILWHFFVNETLTPQIPTVPLVLNFSRLRSDAITDGMNRGRASADVNVRKDAYARAQRAFADEMPYIWLHRDEWRIAASSRVRNTYNVTLPDGSPAMRFIAGTHRLTETWIDR